MGIERALDDIHVRRYNVRDEYQMTRRVNDIYSPTPFEIVTLKKP